MRAQIEKAVFELQNAWKNLTMESVDKIKTTMQTLANDQELIPQLLRETRNLPGGLELYRDKAEEFVLLTYSESQGTYRAPHNHGSAWVIYAVVAGDVEMGNYFEASSSYRPNHLILKNREILPAGNIRIYLPGEIHDTRCISETTTILRLTSLNLKEEERAGRMKRYHK